MRVLAGIFAVLLALVIWDDPAFAQGVYAPISVTGYNRDEIAEAFPAVSSTTADVDDVRWTWVARSFPGSTIGLPLDRKLETSTHRFLLNSYSTNNALRLLNSTGTLTLDAPKAYPSISILASSGSGSANTTVQVNFVGGDVYVHPAFTVSDWFLGASPFPSFGRVDRQTDAVENLPAGGLLHVYDISIPPAQASLPIESIAIRSNSATTVLNVMAVAGYVPPAVPTLGSWAIFLFGGLLLGGGAAYARFTRSAA